MKAIQNPLTSRLHWLKTLFWNPDITREISTYVLLQRKPRINYESLIKHPSSLPLATPMQSEHHLRDMITHHLPQLRINRSVKNLFDFQAETQKSLSIRDLTPFKHRLVNKL